MKQNLKEIKKAVKLLQGFAKEFFPLLSGGSTKKCACGRKISETIYDANYHLQQLIISEDILKYLEQFKEGE